MLDIAFIALFKTGIKGAAWATVIAQGVSGVACFIYMKKRYHVLKFEKDELKRKIIKVLDSYQGPSYLVF